MSGEGKPTSTGLVSNLDALKAALTAFPNQKGENLELWNHALVKNLLGEDGLVSYLQNFGPVEMKNEKDPASSDVTLVFKYIRSMLNCLLIDMNHAPTWTGRDDTGEQAQENFSKYAVLVVSNGFALSAACALVDPSPAELGSELKEFIPIFYYETPATLKRMKTGEKTAKKYKGSGRRPEEKHTLQQVPKATEKVAKKKDKIKEKLNNEGKVQASKEKQGFRLLGFDALYKNMLAVFVQLLGKVKFKALDTAFDPIFSTRDYKIPDSFEAVVSLAHELFVQLEILMGSRFKDFRTCSTDIAAIKAHNIKFNPNVILWAHDIGMVQKESLETLSLDWKKMLEIIYAS